MGQLKFGQSLRHVELVEHTSSRFDIVLIFFHVLVLQEYWVLAQSKIPLRLVLGGVRSVALSISSHEQRQLTRVCFFLYGWFSLFLKDPFFQIIQAFFVTFTAGSYTSS